MSISLYHLEHVPNGNIFLKDDVSFMSMVPHLCFHIVSIGGILSLQASLPIQRHHILSRALSSHTSHHTSHTDDSYTLYSSTHPVLTHHNGLDQHPGSVRELDSLGWIQSTYTYKLTISLQEPIQVSVEAKNSSIPHHVSNINSTLIHRSYM